MSQVRYGRAMSAEGSGQPAIPSFAQVAMGRRSGDNDQMRGTEMSAHSQSSG